MVDPLTLILTALSVSPFADKAARDAYQVLKALLQRKFADKAQLELALTEYIKDPVTWEKPLKKALTEVQADKDEEVLTTARTVLDLVDLGRSTSLDQPGLLGPDPGAVSEDQTIQGHRYFEDQIPIDQASEEHLPAKESEPEPQKRWINAEFQDHDWTKPLKLTEVYTLAFDVGIMPRDTAGFVPLDESRLFEEGEKQVVLIVRLSSRDFTIYTKEPQRLFVPRTGKSKNKARFDIEPRSRGIGEITATFYRDNNFIQSITLKVAVEDPRGKAIISVESLGRAVEGAFAVRPRDVSLFIRNTGTGFAIEIVGTVFAEGTLPLTLPQLNKMIDKVRKDLHDLVHMTFKPYNTPVYQTGIDIPTEVNQQALQRLARSGFDLYQGIFYGEDADAQTILLGDRLRELIHGETLNIQIASKQFLLPWGLMYMVDKYDANHIDPEMFLGLKHIIEQIPLQQNMKVLDHKILSHPSLHVSLNVNTDIDRQMKITVIADQLAYWQDLSKRGGTHTVTRSESNEVLQALAQNAVLDQILYFYCHAVARQLDDEGGPDASCLTLSNRTRLTLGDLKTMAPMKEVLPGKPLVFINACESAELSPLFYGGFMPYFTTKGARGMIGTESDVPALFAAAWARSFFDQFLRGEKSLGQIFLDLRRQFFYEHNNILGLLYALYCDGDTQIVPGLQLM